MAGKYFLFKMCPSQNKLIQGRYIGQGGSVKCVLTPRLTQNRDCYFCIV